MCINVNDPSDTKQWIRGLECQEVSQRAHVIFRVVVSVLRLGSAFEAVIEQTFICIRILLYLTYAAILLRGSRKIQPPDWLNSKSAPIGE